MERNKKREKRVERDVRGSDEIGQVERKVEKGERVMSIG